MKKSKQLGFLAVGNGQVIQLTKPTGPRKQLLEHFRRQHCRKVYVDHKDGTTVHVGYIVAGTWWNVYRVLPLED